MATPTIIPSSVPPPPFEHSDTPYASSELFTPNNPNDHELSQPQPKPRQDSLSKVSRSRAFSTASSTSSVRRKPLPPDISLLAVGFSTVERLPRTVELPQRGFARPFSIDSPTVYDFITSGYHPPPSPTLELPEPDSDDSDSDSSRLSDEHTPISAPPTPPVRKLPQTERALPRLPQSPSGTRSTSLYFASAAKPQHARLTSDTILSTASRSVGAWHLDGDNSSSDPRSPAMSIFSNNTTNNLLAPINIAPRNKASNEYSNTQLDIAEQKPLPKTPSKSPIQKLTSPSKLGAFFGWTGSYSPTSSTTTFSDKAYSPIPSPIEPSRISEHITTSLSISRPVPRSIDIPRANDYFDNSILTIPPATPTTTIQVEEMEEELKDISAELAASIRREMDLEDLVDRLQADAANNTSTNTKRTSDYYSDSGYSSSYKYGDTDPKQDELDRVQRKAEQERAQITLELTAKVQDERSRRKILEVQIRGLEEKASQFDLVRINSIDDNERLKQLESTCEDLRRRLAEERSVKENYEDLLTALKADLQASHNERDNLRDEIVPQLRARVEGLEAQSAEQEQLQYEQSRIQQEVQKLKDENLVLKNARQTQIDMQQQMNKFNTIVEEASALPMKPRASTGLTRSNSLARGSIMGSRPPSGGLSRSNSVKLGESRDALAERVKEVELQRDALHRALKSLLERQELQNRDNEKRIRQLEAERDKALTIQPKRLGYNRDVAALRDEINELRRRAVEAIEQKDQCEKGLSGLKMDLDRAEQEISSLRALLNERDISIPSREINGVPSSPLATSESLEKSYRDLQRAYADSLERVKTLEVQMPKDEETKRAMAQLQQSLSAAISERDFIQTEADAYKSQIESLKASEKEHVAREFTVADELRDSARRVEDLATQVRQQMATNGSLRQRLAEAIGRGEAEQKSNASRIMHMQSKLKVLEEQLVDAQHQSEESISKHEEKIREMKESHNIQLQRMKDGLKSPRRFSSKTPMSPMFANAPGRSPRVSRTSSGPAMSISAQSKISFLQQKVVDLEKALSDADNEMEEVVGKMNIAQIEVMELQNEREEAVRMTKKLQTQIEAEKLRQFEEKFKMLSSSS